MGFRDLQRHRLENRLENGEKRRREESLRRTEERAKLRRELIKAFTGELEPPKESVEEPKPDKKRKEDESVEESETLEKSEDEPVPAFVTPKPTMDPDLYRTVLNGGILSFNKLTASKGWSDNLGLHLGIQVSPQENTVLHVAASAGHEEIVKTILPCCFPLLTSENSDGDTPLHLAARGGHLSTVVAMINWWEGPLPASERLYAASAAGDTNPINCVKKFNASSSSDIKPRRAWELEYLFTVKNNSDNTALHEALKNGHEGVANFLTGQESKIWGLSNGENKSPLYLAAEAGFLAIVNHIVNNSKQNRSDWLKGMSPAIAAILARRTDVLKAIMQLPAGSRGLTDEFGRTPLHYAAWSGYVEGVEILLGEPTLSACRGDFYGLSPLHIAATNGHVDVIKKFRECCPYSDEFLDLLGQNILHAAAECGKENVVTYILKTRDLERLINARDIEGRTPLHLATLSGHPKIVSILTKDKERIDMKAMTEEGYTALDIAAREVEKKYSFRRRLTWMALRAARAPSSQSLHNLYERTRLEARPWAFRGVGMSSVMDSFKDRVNTLQVVATLIATISFAAGFTLPGGYSSEGSDMGVATLWKKRMFQAYVICDTISLYSSIIVVVGLIWGQLGDVHLMRLVLKCASPLLGLSLTMISLTFTTGVYLAVSKLNWLGVAVLLMGAICLLGILILFVPLWFPQSSNYFLMRHMSYYVFLVMLFIIGSDEDDSEGSSYPTIITKSG